jgi:hypothetical protein
MDSRLKNGAALANQDTSCGDKLTTKALHTKPFADAIASVPRTTSSFLMRHITASMSRLCRVGLRRCRDVRHSQPRLPLTMALSFLVTLASLMFIYEDFLAATLPNDCAHDPRLWEMWLANGDLCSLANHEHRIDLNSIPCHTLDLLDRNDISL